MFQAAFVPYPIFSIDFIKCDNFHDMHFAHYHDAYEVYFQIDGTRFLLQNDSCYELNPGNIYILHPFKMHYSQSQGSTHYERYVINFKKEDLSKILTSKECDLLFSRLREGIFHLNEEQCDKLYEILRDLNSYSNKEGECEKKSVN